MRSGKIYTECGGFVFTQVHDIQADVPPENIMAMYKAVEKYGRYR